LPTLAVTMIDHHSLRVRMCRPRRLLLDAGSAVGEGLRLLERQRAVRLEPTTSTFGALQRPAVTVTIALYNGHVQSIH